MASYSTRIKSDIERWREAGLIDAPTASQLARDVEAREVGRLSFGMVLAIMSGVLFGAAILIFVAANWESLPRLMRVMMLFAVIVAGYVGGAILKSRGHGAYAETAWLIGASGFGGAIALIGQMYHLSGDESTALVTWCLGTGFAASLLRSGPLTVAAAGIAAAWLLADGLDLGEGRSFPHLYVLLVLLLWPVSLWTRSRAARHLLLLSLILYAVLLALPDHALGGGLLIAAVSAGLMALGIYRREPVEHVMQLEGGFAAHCLIGFLSGMALVHIELAMKGTYFLAAILTFAGIAAALVFAGRENRSLRWIAYIGFSLELAFVYVVTVGTMLGTAGLFFASGLMLGAVAFLIIRIERRLVTVPPAQGGFA